MFKGDQQQISNGGQQQNFIAMRAQKEGDDDSGRSANNFQRTLVQSVRSGAILLLEDMSEEIDTSIDPIVSKAIYKEEGIYKINLGDKPVEYDANFKLFLTTKLANPHFLPEVSIKLSVINFTVTFDGLDE